MAEYTISTQPLAARQDPVVRLANSQTDRLVQVLSRAFFNDPTFVYISPDENSRFRMLQAFFRFDIRYGRLYGEVYTTPAVEGGAIWISPENTAFTLRQMIRTGFLALPFAFGRVGMARLMRFSDLVEGWRKQSVEKQHWYLAGLGVEPSKQGRGIGSELLQPILARADAGGFPCYLETLTERNLAFYEKHGFHVARRGEIPKGGPMVWTMVRPPG